MIKIAITIDQEWVPKEIMIWLLDLLEEKKIKATIFATNKPIVDLRNNEIALHPNPYLGNKFDLQNQINELKQIYPNAVGIRMHRLFWDAIMENDLVKKYNLKYASNFLIPNQSVKPFTLVSRLVHFPIFFMDHTIISQKSDISKFSINSFKLEDDNLYVFDFHPNILFTNAMSINYYQNKVKPIYHDYDKLKKIKNNKIGCLNLFKEILTLKSKKNIKFVTLNEELKYVKKF